MHSEPISKALSQLADSSPTRPVDKLINSEKHPSSPDRDSNLDIPVLGSRAQHETSALANYATEADVLEPVGNLTLRFNTGNYIELGWDPPIRQDCVTEYEVCLDQLDEVNGTTHCENVTETFWYARFINIYPCTYYDINVTAYSNVSEPSTAEEIHVHTGPYQVINSCTSSNSTDEIYVSWLAPWGESCVTSYNIKWCGGDMYSFRCYLNISGETNVSEDARDYLITGLEPDVYYNVLITALGEDDTASEVIERPQKTCSPGTGSTGGEQSTTSTINQWNRSRRHKDHQNGSVKASLIVVCRSGFRSYFTEKLYSIRHLARPHPSRIVFERLCPI
uniref:Fibronectin type-III domain-containing protein n=1 Tax=Timema bartmani TaxID=61472 RepID=A0A7R9HY20_9NEOP|nr:unnamed protein product [Timema bartmani]